MWISKPGYRHLICGDICNIGQTMTQNIIFGNSGTFHPGLPFSDNFDKGTSSRCFAKIFIFVLVPRNLIMSGVRPDSILSPFSEIIPQIIRGLWLFWCSYVHIIIYE